jgi:hypothetical protein
MSGALRSLGAQILLGGGEQRATRARLQRPGTAEPPLESRAQSRRETMAPRPTVSRR